MAYDMTEDEIKKFNEDQYPPELLTDDYELRKLKGVTSSNDLHN